MSVSRVFDVSSPVAVIDKLAFGGNGICRIDGKVCFIPFSCPGDEVRLKITNQKKSYCTADILELVSSSPSRTEPGCPIFGSCGGCSWQHISYPVQLEEKRRIFADTLWRGARVGSELIGDVAAAPLQYGYRCRVQFKLSVRNGTLRIGFFRHGTHEVEDATQGCPVAVPQINEMLKCFRAVLPLFSDMGAITQITMDAGERELIAVVRYTGQEVQKIRSFLITRSSELMPCTGLLLQTGRKPVPEKLWGGGEISYLMPGRSPDEKSSILTYRAGGFAQVNQRQNVALLSLIRRLGEFAGTEDMLDLYCGNGNFTIPLAADVASVTGIEGFRDSIDSAEQNCSVNGVLNAEFICLDVCTALARLVRDGRTFDSVLLDPPRTGALDAVPDIARLNPGRIIYVSCDPATLARDCGLLSGYGYHVAESVPVDMFPQTYHLESVTLLQKM
jgi:23S rRNA (uracil1939-C5)-methyltransferase